MTRGSPRRQLIGVGARRLVLDPWTEERIRTPAMTAARDSRTKPCAEATEAFQALFREHYGFVWRTARRMGAPGHSIDDVVQDVFLAVHQRLEQFEGRGALKSWLFGITTNVVRMHRRREARRRRRAEAAGQWVVARPQRDPAEHHAAVDMLDRMIRKLDPAKRAVFVLIELEDVEPKEVAQTFGLSVNTVHSRLRLARKQLEAEVRRIRARQRRER